MGKGSASSTKKSSSQQAVQDDNDFVRQWTQFELNAVFALICNGEHLKKKRGKINYAAFAEKLNNALDYHEYSDEKPISEEDVEEVIKNMYTSRKYGMRYLDRQPPPFRLTRKKRLVLMRELPFDGTRTEWIIQNRKQKVAEERAKRRAEGRIFVAPRRDQTIISAKGREIDRYVPHHTLEIDRYVPDARSKGKNKAIQSPPPHPAGLRGDEKGERSAGGDPCGPNYNGCPSSQGTRGREAQLLAIIKDADPGTRTARKLYSARSPPPPPPRPRPLEPPTSTTMDQFASLLRSDPWGQADTPTSPAMTTSPAYMATPRPPPMLPDDPEWARILNASSSSIHPRGPLLPSPSPFAGAGASSPLLDFGTRRQPLDFGCHRAAVACSPVRCADADAGEGAGVEGFRLPFGGGGAQQAEGEEEEKPMSAQQIAAASLALLEQREKEQGKQ